MIRPATVDDAVAIATIHVRGWQAAYAGILSDAFLAALSIEQRTAHWQRVLQLQRPGETSVYVENQTVLGWVDWGPARLSKDGSSGQPSVDPNPVAAAEVFTVYVDTAQLRRGIGTQLMQHAEQRIRHRGIKCIILWVLEQNRLARVFYERLGYAHDGGQKTEVIGGNIANEVRYARRLD